jgi:hypothetical protein
MTTLRITQKTIYQARRAPGWDEDALSALAVTLPLKPGWMRHLMERRILRRELIGFRGVLGFPKERRQPFQRP